MEPQILKILIIEDDPNLGSQMKNLLEAQNHQANIISDGEKAINELPQLKTNVYDAILLDLMLPGANGWQILAKIRSLPEIYNIPVIMLTGINDDSVEARAFYDGADDFMNKPCNMTVLLARLYSIIKRKKQFEKPASFELSDFNNEIPKLSEREKEILVFVAKGLNNTDIARQAFISENTVMNHIKSIKKKLNAKNRIDIAIIAMKHGLV